MLKMVWITPIIKIDHEFLNEAKAFWQYMLKTNKKFQQQIKDFHNAKKTIDTESPH